MPIDVTLAVGGIADQIIVPGAAPVFLDTAQVAARYTQDRAYARIIAAEIALQRGAVPEAVDALREAQKLADLWLVRYALGRAYLKAGQYLQALAEFEACLKRRGEATAIFLDDVPSFRYLAPLPYWLAAPEKE